MKRRINLLKRNMKKLQNCIKKVLNIKKTENHQLFSVKLHARRYTRL